MIDPLEQTVRVWQRHGDEFTETGRSGLLNRTADQVEQAVRWPQA